MATENEDETVSLYDIATDLPFTMPLAATGYDLGRLKLLSETLEKHERMIVVRWNEDEQAFRFYSLPDEV